MSDERCVVTVRCISCKKTREIGPGEIAPGDMPFCDCGSVMVAVKASRRYARQITTRANPDYDDSGDGR
jgi:hypothetical protein